MAVAAGQTFGNFQVVRQIGEGGFGEVYEAQNPFLQRRAGFRISIGVIRLPGAGNCLSMARA